MTKNSESAVADRIIGTLIAKDKYTFANKDLFASVVRDTLEERPFAVLDMSGGSA